MVLDLQKNPEIKRNPKRSNYAITTSRCLGSPLEDPKSGDVNKISRARHGPTTNDFSILKFCLDFHGFLTQPTQSTEGKTGNQNEQIENIGITLIILLKLGVNLVIIPKLN